MSLQFFWNPGPLKAALQSAVRAAAVDFRNIAAQRSASRRVASSMDVTVVGDQATVGSSHPLARLLEGGVQPHEVTPRGRVLRLEDGGFVTGPVRHPGMRAQPTLGPLLPTWTVLYQRRAAMALRASGFGGFGV